MVLLLTSCNDAYENGPLSDDSLHATPKMKLPTYTSDSIDYVDEFGIIIPQFEQRSITNSTVDTLTTDKFTTYSSDNVITVYGYTSKEYMTSKITIFTAQPYDKRLHAMVYYKEDYYKYKYRFTVPKGAGIVCPTDFDNNWPTGMKPSNQSINGYELSEPLFSNASGDTYEFSTIIKEISYNASGQYLGFTSYLPFRVGNPSKDLVFKYIVIADIEW